jgi:hypothetical protein
MKLLEASGYLCTRAAASLGVFDIIGIGNTDIVLCQVKSNRWPDAAEMEQMKLFKAPTNAKRLIHRWRDRVRMPDVKEI